MKLFFLLTCFVSVVLFVTFIYLGGMNDYTSYDDYLNDRMTNSHYNTSVKQTVFDHFDNFVEYNDYLDILTKNDTFYFDDQILRKSRNDPYDALIPIYRKVKNKTITKQLRCMINESTENSKNYNYNEYAGIMEVMNRAVGYKANCIINNEPNVFMVKKLNLLYNIITDLMKDTKDDDKYKKFIRKTRLLKILPYYQVLCMTMSNKYFSRETNHKKLEYGNIGLICDAKLDIMLKTFFKQRESDDLIYTKRKIYYKKNN